MADTPEGRVKKQVKKILEVFHCYHHWPVLTGYGKPELDCTGCHEGRYFAIETKAPGEKVTPRQELIIAEKVAAGAMVFVIGERIENGRYSGMLDLVKWLSRR